MGNIPTSSCPAGTAHRRNVHRVSAATALIVIVAVALSACGSPQAETPGTPTAGPGFAQELDSAQAQEVLGSAQAAGIRVYWLGPEFNIAGLSYQVKGVAFNPDLYGWGEELRVEYGAETPGGVLSLDMTLQTADDWESSADRRAANMRSYTQSAVDIPPWDAILYVKPLLPNEQQVRLVVDTGDTVISTMALPTIDADDRQVNPLSDNPDLLVQVIEENLRPYPE